MRKNYIRLGMAAFVAAALLIIALTAATAESYAGTYYVDNALKEGVATTIRWGTTFDEKAVTYVKIKPSKTGTITFQASFFCYVALCDLNEKVLSVGYDPDGDYIDINNTNPFMQQVHYGVKKGKSYYLRVYQMPQNKDDEGRYIGVMKYTNSKVTPTKPGTSKKKAKAIKKNKKIKGLFKAGDKKAQWFKITNKQKKTKINIAVDKVDYSLKFKVYYKSYNKWYNKTYTLTWQDEYKKDTITATISKAIKHTYYIKVYPNKKTSGSYSIKWK